MQVQVEISGDNRLLSEDIEQNLLRIAQEAVTNALKHASPRMIWVELAMEARCLRLLDLKTTGGGSSRLAYSR